jgi:hypothetical protein
MTLKISHWYGRLGNNIQQCAVGIMAAELIGGTFESINHDTIDTINVSFGDNSQDALSKFFYWEGSNKEIDIDSEYVRKNIRRICKNHISKRLKIPKQELFSDNTIVIHVRSGDIFSIEHKDGHNYVPNPLDYYESLIDKFDQAIIVTENDNHNPIVEILKNNSKVIIQSSSIENDFATLMSAKNLASSGVGTFCVAAALCSNNIRNFYCTDLMLTEHLNYSMIVNTDIEVFVCNLKNYIPIGEWKNTNEQRKFILEYKI